MIEIPILVYTDSRGIETPLSSDEDVAARKQAIQDIQQTIQTVTAAHAAMEEAGIKASADRILGLHVQLAQAQIELDRFIARREEKLVEAKVQVYGIDPYSYHARILARHKVRERDPETGQYDVDGDMVMTTLFQKVIKTVQTEGDDAPRELFPENIQDINLPMARRLWAEVQKVSEPDEGDVTFR